jgi:hypothetical protein
MKWRSWTVRVLNCWPHKFKLAASVSSKLCFHSHINLCLLLLLLLLLLILPHVSSLLTACLSGASHLITYKRDGGINLFLDQSKNIGIFDDTDHCLVYNCEPKNFAQA